MTSDTLTTFAARPRATSAAASFSACGRHHGCSSTRAIRISGGPAAVAQTLYRETEASKEARLKAEAERKAMREFAPLPEHRPSKRDRRRIIQFRGGR